MGGHGGYGAAAYGAPAVSPHAYRPPAAALGGGYSKGGNAGSGGKARLFVFGMPEGLNADMLRGHFARHGQILDIYVPPSKPEIAYITFSSHLELEDALQYSGLAVAGFTIQGLKLAESRSGDKGGGPRRQERAATRLTDACC